MSGQHFVSGIVPDSFLEVDAARLLLILAKFASRDPGDFTHLSCLPQRPCVGHFAPEYYLHKLDFLLRYPAYFAYELEELYRRGARSATNRAELMRVIRRIISNREPTLDTFPFLKFWRGAYERLDDVEAWWHSRRLVYITFELRGDARPWKHYFLTSHAYDESQRLVAEVSQARWYQQRIAEIHRYFGTMTAAEVKNFQYTHPEYRDAQLSEHIPDLPLSEIYNNFAAVFGEPLGVPSE